MTVATGGGGPLAPLHDALSRLGNGSALLAAMAFGAVANLGFAPVHFWPAWSVGVVGLIWLIDGAQKRPRPATAAFWRVFAFGFSYFLVGLHWTASAFLVDARQHLAYIWMAVLLLPGGLALIWAIFLSFARRFWTPGPRRILVFASALLFAEWVRSHLFGGFPWNLPGMVWDPGGAVSQSASIWGVSGLGVVTVLALCSPAALANRVGRGTIGAAAPVLASAVAFGALWGWGAQRLSSEAARAEPPASRPLVRLVDSGVPQNQKFQPGAAWEILRRFGELTGPDAPGAASIVIWPEGALPYFLFEWPEGLDIITAGLGDRRLILGLARRETGDDGQERAYNSLAVLDRDSNRRGALDIYDKHRLVPFGEFTPFREVAAGIGIPTLQQLAVSGFHAGPRPTSMSVPGVPAFGPLICYEVIFPGLAPEREDRPSWLINISNDAWYGRLSGPFQHADQARWRAIEEGLPVARAVSGGLTGMIDPYGRWSARGQPTGEAAGEAAGADPPGWRSSVVEARIPSALPETIYARWGDLAFWMFLAALNLALLVLRRTSA